MVAITVPIVKQVSRRDLWDAFCALPRFSFRLNASGGVARVEERSGNWVEEGTVSDLVTATQETFNDLRDENSAMNLTILELRAEIEELKAKPIVLPRVDTVMGLVLQYQNKDRHHVTGNTNWAANIGMVVVDEVARINKRPGQ